MTTSDSQNSRDSFLELLRNVSVLRVVFLHMVLRPPLVYLPWIQWIYPGMPEIFFVAGTLASISLRRRKASSVLKDRTRRVLLPYLAYAVVAVSAMGITAARSTMIGSSFSRPMALRFLFPLLEPTGSTTRVILWSHLWFVTAFLWLILLSPLLVQIVKRAGLLAILLPFVIFSASIAIRKLTTVVVPPEVTNISQFGTYYVLGLIAGEQRLGSLAPNRKTIQKLWLAVAGGSGLAGVVIALVIEPISRKQPAQLYSSKFAYLFIGMAWLALALAFHGPLSEWTSRHRNRWLAACTQRTFTLYLWGLPADAVGTAVAKKFLPNRWIAVPIYISVSLVALCGAVVLFGWIEDVSARRSPRLLPTLVGN
jgi:peptidoglycan-N-acetylglucosamine deacetylase